MLVIFDCDGVLIDSEVIAAKIGADFANSFGHPITAQESAVRFSGKQSRIVWETICEELGIEFKEDDFRQMQHNVHEAYKTELKIIDGIDEVLQNLGNKFCVASTTRLEQLKTNLINVGLIDFFGENVFSASQVERPKPAPDVFLYAAKNMGYDPEDCLVIEDSIFGVMGACAANMKVIGFLGGGHITQGHDEALRSVGAIDTFENMRDFYEITSKHSDKITRR